MSKRADRKAGANSFVAPAQPKAAQPAVTPFSGADIAVFERVGRALRFDKDARLILIEGSEPLRVTAVTALVASLKQRGGGLVVWATDRSGPELRAFYQDFVASQVEQRAPKSADFKDIVYAKTAVFNSASILLSCLYLGPQGILAGASPSIEEFFNLSHFSCVVDPGSQLSCLKAKSPEPERVSGRIAAAIHEWLPSFSADQTAPLLKIIQCSAEFLRKGEMEKLHKLEAVAIGDMIATKKFEVGLPNLPEGVGWPAARFDKSEFAGKHHGIIGFLEQEWMAVIETGLIHRGHLLQVDEGAAIALRRYLNDGRGAQRSLPPHLPLPPQRLRATKPSP